MIPRVVDANVMNSFQSERLSEIVGPGKTAIAAILRDDFIVLDDSGHCQQEWLDCAGGSWPLALGDWIADMFVAGKIRLSPLCSNSMHKELGQLGIPKKDHKWVRLAIECASPTIVTDDIDLIDPSKKNAGGKALARVKEQGIGPVSKYLRKKYKLDVVCAANTAAYLGHC